MLRPTVGIPMTGISLIINQRRGSPTLPSRIALLNRLQLTVLVNRIRKHEDTGIRNVPEVTRSRGRERSNQNRRIRSGNPCGRTGRGLGVELDRDRVDVLNARFFVGYHVCDDAVGQPERLPALCKRNLEGLDGSFNRCDVDRLLVPTRSETKRQPPLRSRRTCFRDIVPPDILCLHATCCAEIPQEGARTPSLISTCAHARRGWMDGRRGGKQMDLETYKRG